MCDNCPFRSDGAAIELAEGRLEEIKRGVLVGQPFHCHKTVYGGKLGPPRRRKHWQECAGALGYREETARSDPDAFRRALETILAEAKK